MITTKTIINIKRKYKHHSNISVEEVIASMQWLSKMKMTIMLVAMGPKQRCPQRIWRTAIRYSTLITQELPSKISSITRHLLWGSYLISLSNKWCSKVHRTEGGRAGQASAPPHWQKQAELTSTRVRSKLHLGQSLSNSRDSIRQRRHRMNEADQHMASRRSWQSCTDRPIRKDQRIAHHNRSDSRTIPVISRHR